MVLNCLSENKKGEALFFLVNNYNCQLNRWCFITSSSILLLSSRSISDRLLFMQVTDRSVSKLFKFFKNFKKLFFLWKINTDLGSRMEDAIEELKGTWFDFYQVIWQRKSLCTTLRPVFLKQFFLRIFEKLTLARNGLPKEMQLASIEPIEYKCE